MKMMKNLLTSERPDLIRLIKSAMRAANSQEVGRCVDALQHMKSLNLSVKDLYNSEKILTLASLRNHKNPKIRMETHLLFNSWMKTLYSKGISTSSSRSETAEIKPSLKKCNGVLRKYVPPKKQPPLNKSQNPKSNSTALKNNSKKVLELFGEAKKNADLANVKGLLMAKRETSICVHNLTLLIKFPIISTATETGQIMKKLHCLTLHKDRKICNSASALLHHWSHCIKHQQN